jgi:MoaA/NifB/PqqE/SkfB family radical SAM enzyme
MTLITNGLDPVVVEERVKQVLALPAAQRLESFAVSVSLDGRGDTVESIRRVPHAFDRVDETLRRLSDLRKTRSFYLCSTCVVQRSNAGDLKSLWDYGQEIGLPIIFSPVCVSNVYAEDREAAAELVPTQEQLQGLKSMFANDLGSKMVASNAPFWGEFFRIREGQRRRLPCFLLHHYASVNSDGTMRICPQDRSMVYGSVLDAPPDELWYSEAAKETRRWAKEEFCPTCTVCCDMAFCFSHEFFYYSRFLVRDRFRWLLQRFGRLAPNG